jgi:hypothetical protein
VPEQLFVVTHSEVRRTEEPRTQGDAPNKTPGPP